MSITVTTQAELDVVTKAGEQHIIIDSPAGVWLTLRTPESAHVVAWGSAHVEAWGSAHVVATAYVAVHLHSARATVEGGHIIDVSTINLEDVAVWEAYTGATMLLADDGRGFRLGTRNGRYIAGCRDFTAAEAVAHWSNPDHPASESAALLLAAVEAHLATHGDAA